MTHSSSPARRIIVAEAASATAGAEPREKIGFHGGKVAVQRPRVRSYDGHEVALPTWTAAQAEDWLGRWAMNLMLISDLYRQCKYAYYRIKKLLAMHGATLKNVVFVTTYMMDIRHIGASGKCRTEEFAEAGAELPPGASVGVNAFAWPDMLLEIAATAAVEK